MAWQNSQWRTRLHKRILAAEGIIKRLEPLGILLAVIGLAISIISFQIDYQDRTTERKLRAWEIVTSDGPVSGGKETAAAFLIKNGNDLSGAKLEGLSLLNPTFERINLKGTDLRRSILKAAILMDADLGGANLLRADLSGANLTRANLSKANLSKANLSGAISLEQAQLDKACGDANTMLPEELNIQICSGVEWYEKLHGGR